MEMKDWLEAVNYKITSGSEFLWGCYGDSAFDIESWNQVPNDESASLVFDTKTQQVYEASVYDYANDRAYRWVNPSFKTAYNTEAAERGVDADIAWDDVRFVTIEVEYDFLEKLTAIMNHKEYDTRVVLPIDIPDTELFELMKQAHERDITLNQLMNEVIASAIANADLS
jgi:hypothetical protein